MDRAAFGALVPLAFFAMLRPGELVIGVNAAHTMRYNHVQVNRNGVEMIIPSSKTSPTEFKVQLSARPDLSICPVSAIRAYIALRGPGSPSEMFFVNGRRRPITCRDLTTVLRQAGRMVGLDGSLLSGHCLRISGASHGAGLGLFELQLGRAGRWSSSALRRYLRRPVSMLQLTPRDVQSMGECGVREEECHHDSLPCAPECVFCVMAGKAAVLKARQVTVFC